MNLWFLKLMSKNAWLEENPKAETEQEVDLALASISYAVDGASLQWQINCKKTLVKASKYIDPDSTWEGLDGDMALRLLRLCSDFTTDDMQELVAKILAWEYNHPWSFSLKTLEVVRNLRKNDIELFQKFCWYVFNWKYYLIQPYTSGSQYGSILSSEWIWYDKLVYLQDLWLVGNNDSAISVWHKDNNEEENEFNVSIQNQSFSFKKKGYFTVNDISLLTIAWIELLSIIEFVESEQLIYVVQNHFSEIFK